MSLTQQLSKTQPIKQIAQRIVNECLLVQPDEQITIFSWDHTIDYANSLALEVEQAGGVSTSILQTNDFYWTYLKEVPEVQFTRRQKGYLALLDQTDGMIALGGPKDPSIFPTVPEGRTTKMFDGQKPVADRLLERKIRVLYLPQGFVTPERAKTYGFDYEDWQRITTNSLDVDYGKISALGGKMEARLRDASDVRIAAPNGTDLRLRLKDRAIHVHDGIIDQTDSSKGATQEILPAGAIEVAPDETSSEGTVVFDQPTALFGKMISGMKWSFENGRLREYRAESNQRVFDDFYKNASGEKDRIGNIVVGLNPRAELIGLFADRVVQGTVSIGIGGNKSIGGDNDTQFSHEETLRRPTLSVNGYTIVKDGKLQL